MAVFDHELAPWTAWKIEVVVGFVIDHVQSGIRSAQPGEPEVGRQELMAIIVLHKPRQRHLRREEIAQLQLGEIDLEIAAGKVALVMVDA